MIGVEGISQVPVNWLKVTPLQITADLGVLRTVRKQRISSGPKLGRQLIGTVLQVQASACLAKFS